MKDRIKAFLLVIATAGSVAVPNVVSAQSNGESYPVQDGAPQGYPQAGPTFPTPPSYFGGPQNSAPSSYYGGVPVYNNTYGAPPAYGGYTGYNNYSNNNGYQNPQFGPPGMMLHPRVATAPSGLTIPVVLQTAISTQVAREGDFVQAEIDKNVALSGLAYIPSGAVITGQITQAQAGRMMDRSGSLGIEFDKLQMPDGQTIPIQAHVLGDIGNYEDKDGVYHGEGFGTKFGNFALRTAIGAGSGAALGTALGAITGRVGTGAWAGTAIGGGLGAMDSIFLRKGRNVLIQSGTPMQIQLDAPVQVPVQIQPQYGAS